MNKALIIPIHKKWVDLIKKGLKTRELRTWIPKGYVGTVFVVSTKSSGGSGKVELSFWFDEYDVMKYVDGNYEVNPHDIPLKLCLDIKQINNYGKGKTLYAWHIKKLEVFDEPKSLSEFVILKKFTYGLGSRNETVKEYRDLTKAPQRSQWVYVNE